MDTESESICILVALFLTVILLMALSLSSTFGRTLEVELLIYKLAATGLIAGLFVGYWRGPRKLNLLLRSSNREVAAAAAKPCYQTVVSNLMLGYVLVLTLFVIAAGSLINRLIPIGGIKIERTVVSEMPASTFKRPKFWLTVPLSGYEFCERVQVSAQEYRSFRVFDEVEIHTRRGLLGYNYVTDIVKVGSRRGDR